MKSVLNHVAFLVTSIESALEGNTFNNDSIGIIEDFPGEGTRELYVGDEDQMGRLLFMQAIGAGPYMRALDKRGPGLHHIALDVEDIDLYVRLLNGSGWMLHPKSLELYNANRQVFLCRPGVPVLIEVQEREALVDENFFVEKVQFPFADEKSVKALGCDRLLLSGEVKVLNNRGDVVWKSARPS